MSARLRVLYRALARRLPPGPRVAVTMALIRLRRRARARRGLAEPERPWLVLVLGADPADLAACAAAVVADARTLLVVTDVDDLSALRAQGLLGVYLPPADAVAEVLPETSYDGFVARRLEHIAGAHAARGLLHWDGAELAPGPGGADRGSGSSPEPGG